MKKFLIMLAIAGVSLTSMAQETETTTEKYSVATNSFWSNWFVQGGVQWTAFYSSLEHGFDTSNNPFKSFRSNPQASVAIGKWFTPGLGPASGVRQTATASNTGTHRSRCSST